MEPTQSPLTTNSLAATDAQAALLMRLMPASAMRALATAISGSATLIDRDLRIVYSSNPVTDPTGERATQLAGRLVTDLSTPDSEARGTNAIRQALTAGAVTSFETKMQRADGGFDIVEGRATPVYEGDVIVGALVQTRDITREVIDLVNNRQLLAQINAVLSRLAGVSTALQLLETLETFLPFEIGSLNFITEERGMIWSDFITTIDRSMGKLQVIPDGTRLQLEQFPLWNLMTPTPNQAFIIEDVTTDPRLHAYERGYMASLGIASLLTMPLYSAGKWTGSINLAYATQRDFTASQRALINAVGSTIAAVLDNIRLLNDLARTVDQLQIAKRIADDSSRVKSEFLATMSHELRTPLNAIEGFTSIMLNKMGGVSYNDRTEGFLQRISGNNKRLLALINDFLDLSRIESGRMELVRSPMDVNALIDSWRGVAQVLADEKQLTLTIERDPALPTRLLGDSEAISKVVINLLGNAVKFTEQGGISVRLTRPANDQWAITVEDTGIGIPPHARELVFEEFRQVDQSSRRRFGGTGLGLSIAQKFVRLMGGVITLESDLGKGSSFTVTLPLIVDPIVALED